MKSDAASNRAGAGPGPRKSMIRRRDAGSWRSRRPAVEALESRRLLAASLSEFPIRTVGGATQGITYDPDDGDIWVAEPDTIEQINPITGAVIQTYPIPTYDPGESLITYDHTDGDLWFYEPAANQFGVLDPTAAQPDQAITEIPLMTNPDPGVTSIVADGQGNIWFTESNFDEVGMLVTTDITASTPQTVSQFHLSPGAVPYGITLGPSDDIWFTESGLNQIGWIGPTSHVIQEIPIIGAAGTVQSEGITEGPDDTVWFTEAQANKVVMYNPQSSSSPFTFFSIPANAKLDSITWGENADGKIWFTEPGLGEMGVLTTTSTAPSQLSNSYYSSASFVVPGPYDYYWINDTGGSSVAKVTAKGAVTAIAIPSDSVNNPQGIASLDGEIWFADYNDNEIGMFDPTTHDSTEYPLPSGSANPDQIIAVGGDLWFTDYGSNQISEFDPATDAVIAAYGLSASGGGPTGICYDQQDGYFWFTEPNDNAIGYLDPTGVGSPSHVYSVGNNTAPYGIVADSSGNIWFTDSGSGPIGEYTPSTATWNAYGSGVGDPYNIIIGPDGNLWYTAYFANAIFKMNPTTHAVNVYGVPGHSEEGVSSGTDALTVGADGNIWYTEIAAFTGGETSYVGSVSMTGTGAEDQQTPGAVVAAGIVAGPDGNIWFTSPSRMIGDAAIATAAVGTQLAVTTQPPAGVTAGEPVSDGFGLVVSVEDAAGQLDTFFQSNQGSVTIQLKPPAGVKGGAFLSGKTTEPVENGLAVFSGLTINDPGDGYTIQATLSGLAPASSAAFDVTSQATQLQIVTGPPATVAAGSLIPLVLEAVDDDGEVDASYDGPVTLSLLTGTGPLVGTSVVGAVGGIATFSDLSVDEVGTGDRIQATSEDLVPAITSAFDVTIGPTYEWVIQTAPSSTAMAGVPLATQPVLAEEDQYGNIETGDSSTVVTASVVGGTGTIAGDTAQVVDGVATFSGLTYDTAATVQFLFSGGPLESALSGNVVISPAAPSRLVLTTGFDSPDVAGTAGTVTITAYDAFGNVDGSGPDQYKGTVDLTGSDGQPSGLATKYTFTAADAGSHTFGGVVLTTAGDQTITATDDANSTLSADAAVNVVPGPASQVEISSPPLALVAGARGLLTVAFQDAYGNDGASPAAAQTISLYTTSTAGGFYAAQGSTTPIGSLSVAAGQTSAGVYYGDGQVGTPTITAFDAGLGSFASQQETITAGAAGKLVVVTQPSPAATAGTAFSVAPVVYVEDAGGNLETGDDTTVVSASLADGAGTLQGTTAVTVQGGIATFSDLYDTTAGPIALAFSAGGGLSATSSNIIVSPGAPSQLVVGTQPSAAATAGQPFATQPVVDEEDQYGNIEVGDDRTIITATLQTGVGPLEGKAVTVSGGVATFGGLFDNTAETITLAFTGGGLTSAASDPVTVGPGRLRNWRSRCSRSPR